MENKVFVDLAGNRRVGHVVKRNEYTVWVKVMKGARTYDIIKRHVTKHNVIGPDIDDGYPDDCQGPFCAGEPE